MSFGPPSDGVWRRSFSLNGRPSAIILDQDGVHHPGGLRGVDAGFTPYDEITHVAASPRSVWIGSRRSVYMFSVASFDEPEAAERMVRQLVTHISHLPDGEAQIERMRRIEGLAQSVTPLRATWGLVVACLVVFLMQLVVGQAVHEVGYFRPMLVNDGDLWRVFTANLVHAAPQFPLHLIFNLAGLIFLGTLLERPLGVARTLWVMGLSALGAMLACVLVDSPPVVGSSGVVFGLAGGLVWLELRCPEQLPAPWRIPRRVLVFLLMLNLAIMILLPIVSGPAHAGGFIAGWLATAPVGRRALAREPARLWVRAAAAAFIGLVALSMLAAGERLASEPDYVASHARRLASLPGISPIELNQRAWMIATRDASSDEQMSAALAMAQRAVQETDRTEAVILDTLAEVQFQLGWREEAIRTIDEAIAIDPNEAYYVRQRERFVGRRIDEPPPTDALGTPPSA